MHFGRYAGRLGAPRLPQDHDYLFVVSVDELLGFELPVVPGADPLREELPGPLLTESIFATSPPTGNDRTRAPARL